MAAAIAFGPYELDLCGRELRKRGLPVKLRGQSIEVLAALLESPGQLITRDELQARLWPGVRYADFDNGLNSAVNRLRESLGDSAREPRYVETVPGRGYRFIGTVALPPTEGPALEDFREAARVDNGGSQPRLAAAPVGLAPRRLAPTRPAVVRLAVATVVSAVIFAVVGLLVWRGADPTAEEPKPVALVSMGGLADEASFSPDGDRVAFKWRAPKEFSHEPGEDQCGIYIKLIGGGPPQRLTRGERDRRPAWSPDHRYIAFLRGVGESGALMLVPSIGGPERTLAKVDSDLHFSNLSWTPDAKWLVLSARESPQEPYGLWLLSAETGEHRRLLAPPAAATKPTDWPGDFAGTLSGDGRTLPFARNTGSWRFQLYELRLTPGLRPEGEPRRLTDQSYLYFSGAAWAGKNELVYSADANSRLWRMRFGESPRLLGWAPQIAYWPSIALSQHRLVYAWATGNENLWRLNLRTGECRMIIGSGYWQHAPRYSPDGRRIAFIGYRTGRGEAWTCDADGANCQQITFRGGGTPCWSPDGRWLALDSREKGKSQIYVVPADGGTPRPVTTEDATSQEPSWSHDGRWIYFNSDRDGQWRIWKAPAAGGPAVQVTHNTAGMAFESADGKYVYFSSGNAPLFRVSAAGGDEIQIAPKAAGLSVTAKGVYFMSDERTLQLLDAASGRISTVAKLDKNSVTHGMSVSQDDAYMVFSQLDRVSADIMLVENFR